MLTRAITRAVLRASVPACVAVCLAAPPAAAASPDVAFPADGRAMQAALFTAKAYWGKDPCGGSVRASWADLATGDAAISYWLSATDDAFATPESNTDCRIEFNRRQAYDWPRLCTVAVHEVGHLLGHDHTADHTHVMAETYSRPLPACLEVAAKAGLLAERAKPRAARRLSRKRRIAMARLARRARNANALR